MIQVFIAGILWGVIGVFVKGLASLGADGALTGFLRMFWAFVIVLAVSLVKHGRGVILRDKTALFYCVLLGLVSNGIFNILYTASIRINGMGIACVLMYTAPVFTAVASAIIFREKFSPLKISALCVNIIGCVLTVTGGDFSGSDVSLAGILAGLGSGFGYGMAAVIGRLAGERTDSLTVSVYSYLAAWIFIAVFTRPDIPLALGSPKIMGLGFLYGLVPTVLAYLVYYNALRIIPDTAKVPVIASVEPVTAVLIGIMIYGEEIGAANLVGVAVVMISIIIMAKAK
ncbi:MAG: EamA family transporter [Synergistaceae bacterium]|nr:EamA family transporter [Synergistaceae bacterium]